MSAQIDEPARQAARTPWRVRRGRRPLRAPMPQLGRPSRHVRAAVIVAAIGVSAFAVALGAVGIRREPAPARSPTEQGASAPKPQTQSPARLQRIAAASPSRERPASIASTAPAAASAARQGEEDQGRDFTALGLRVRPLSNAERRELGERAPEQAWKIINSTGRRTSLRAGDIIVGACEQGASLQAVMAGLTEGSEVPCVVVLRSGDSVRAGPVEPGPNP